MARRLGSFLFALGIAALLPSAHGAAPEAGDKRKGIEPRLNQFFAAKEQHGRSLAKDLKLTVAPEVWEFFAAGRDGDWSTVRRLWGTLRNRSGQYAGEAEAPVRTAVWATVLEAELARECFNAMEMKFVETFARDTLEAIPRDSIYFGGTDSGRGVITAFCKSHAQGDPFIVLTQNGLADSTYLAYLRATFGKKIALPTDDDSKACFDEYIRDAGERLEQGKLKPGEKVTKEDGKTQVSGQISVMEINGLIAKIIFERNPKREFYVEESFPLDWMYPHLSPRGPVLKLNRQPVSALSEATLAADREYWRNLTGRFLGPWLTETTSVQTVCEFVERVYGDAFLDKFSGDQDYVLADRSSSPRRMFGKLRQAQAVLYEWRWEHSAAPAEKEVLKKAADLAFKQLLALCPDEPEYVRHCVQWFKKQNLPKEARRVADAGLRLSPGSKRLSQLVEELE